MKELTTERISESHQKPLSLHVWVGFFDHPCCIVVLWRAWVVWEAVGSYIGVGECVAFV